MKINFNRNLILGKEELDRWYQSLDEKLKLYLQSKKRVTQNIFALLQQDTELQVTENVGTNNKVNIASGYTLNLSESNSYVNEYFTNSLQLDTSFTPVNGDERWVALSEQAVGYELESTANISASSNQMTITGNAGAYLRDMSGRDQVKIKFYKTSGLLNTGIYDVVNKIDANNFIISGGLSDESDLKIIIIGTYDLEKITPTNELYTHKEVIAGVYTTLTDNLLPLAKIKWTSGIDFTITDYRNIYNFDNIVKKNDTSFFNDLGLVVKDEIKFEESMYIYGNKYNKVSDSFLLTSTILTIPSSLFNNSNTNFTSPAPIYKIKGDVTNKTIQKIGMSGAILVPEGTEVKLLVDINSNEDIIIETVDTIIDTDTIYNRNGGNRLLTKGSIAHLIYTTNGWNLLNLNSIYDDWHIVGEVGQPAFETGWSKNVNNPLMFRKTEDNQLQIFGEAISTADNPSAVLFYFGASFSDYVPTLAPEIFIQCKFYDIATTNDTWVGTEILGIGQGNALGNPANSSLTGSTVFYNLITPLK